MEERNFELLRTVTTETPVGTKVMWNDGSNSGELLGFDVQLFPVFKGHLNNGAIVVARIPLYIVPLAWVEGKPVYKGDVLWVKSDVVCDYRMHEVAEVRDGAFYKDQIYDVNGKWTTAKHLTWQSPKVKREGWVNIYSDNEAYIHSTRNEADSRSSNGRIACVRIEWEEPSTP